MEFKEGDLVTHAGMPNTYLYVFLCNFIQYKHYTSKALASIASVDDLDNPFYVDEDKLCHAVISNKFFVKTLDKNY